MIKVGNSCLVQKSKGNLQTIADFHLSKVNPIRKDTKPSLNSITHKLLLAKKTFLDKGYLLNFCNNDKKHQSRLLKFVDYCSININRIILAEPNVFKNIISEINKIVIPSDWNDIHGNKTEFHRIISENVFNYSGYRNSKGCIDTYKKLIGTQAQCFYCNNHKMDVVKYESTKDKLFFDLDHFYLKSKYPYLSLSFFNLIPCCGLCNSTVRGSIEFTNDNHINPYENCFDSEYRFRLPLEQLVKLNIGCDNPFSSVDIELRENSKRVNDFSVRDLKLAERYQNEITTINNLAMKYIKHSYLKDEFLDVYVDMIYGLNYCDIPQCPEYISVVQLGKLKRDIITQLLGED